MITEKDVERKTVAILQILKDVHEPIGSRIISRELKTRGIDLTERAVRYHLRIMDERGLTKCLGREGRLITPKGINEANDALVSDKVGMIINKVDTLSYRTTFDIDTQSGDVILNTSFIPAEQFERAKAIMEKIFAANICVTDLVFVAEEGEHINGIIVPKGKIALGTICGVTINGVLLNHRIPVYSKFGGILQVERSDICAKPSRESGPNIGGENSNPIRFTEIISYSGSSLDPAEIFIKSRMTDVRSAAQGEQGKILAGFREFPAICLNAVQEILHKLEGIGMSAIIALGKPSQPLLEIPVSTGCVGMVVLGGLNPIAAVEEAGIETESSAMSTMIDYSELRNIIIRET